MSCESYDLRLTTLSPIHIGSGKSYSCCEFVPAKAKSKGQIVKIIKRVNLTNYYSSLSDDRKDTFLASLTNSNFELKQFDKKIKKDFVRYQCIDNSRVDFINEVQEHIKTSDKLYIPGSSIKGAIRTAIFYNLLTEEDMDKIGRDISSNRRNNSFLSNDLLKKHFTSGFGNDAQYNIFRFMQVADTTTTNLPRIEQVLAVMATDDRRKNQFYSRHGKVVKSYLETIGANKNLEEQLLRIFDSWFLKFELSNEFSDSKLGLIPKGWKIDYLGSKKSCSIIKSGIDEFDNSKIYIATADVDNSIITSNDTLITMDDKPSRANMQPISNSIWFAKMIDSKKLIMVDEYCNDLLNNYIFSTGFCGLKCVDKYFYYLWTFLLTDVFDVMKNNFCTGTTMQAINNKDTKLIEFVLPDDKTITQFNSIAKPMFKKIYYNNLEIKKLQRLRDALLPKLMSGEIDVSKINCDLELKYNYMKYLFNQIHTPMSKSVV